MRTFAMKKIRGCINKFVGKDDLAVVVEWLLSNFSLATVSFECNRSLVG